MSKKWAMGVGVIAAGAGLALSMIGSATAAQAIGRTPNAIQVQQLTLRLASDPSQVANVAGASNADGAPIIQWPLSNTANERWEAESTLDGYYRFKAVSSGKCLNVQGGGTQDNTPVIQYACGNFPNELWKLVPTGIGYQLVNQASNKCLNVRGGVGQGNPLIQYTCVPGGAPNDVWLPVWEDTLR